MEVIAKLNRLRMSPRKVRLTAALIRRMTIDQAETQLRFLNKGAALPLLKLLRSAVANAKHNFKLEKDLLWIKQLNVDSGQTIKRWRPRAFGRAAPIRKRTSKIRLILSSDPRPLVKTKRIYKPRRKNNAPAEKKATS